MDREVAKPFLHFVSFWFRVLERGSLHDVVAIPDDNSGDETAERLSKDSPDSPAVEIGERSHEPPYWSEAVRGSVEQDREDGGDQREEG